MASVYPQELGLDTEPLEIILEYIDDSESIDNTEFIDNTEPIDNTDEMTGVEESISLMKECKRKDLAATEANAKNEESIATIQDLIARLAAVDKEHKLESIAKNKELTVGVLSLLIHNLLR